jgi:competence protein ComEA
VAEWSNAPDSKSGVRFQRTVGSNPTLSAKNPSRRNSMKHSIFRTVMIALTLLMAAGLSLADETQVQKAKQARAAAKAASAAKQKKPAAPQVQLVDINSATKEELKKLPGIGDADADKIIAGRPYLTKAHLVTHNIISAGVYQTIQQMVVARQKDAKFTKDVKTKSGKK